MIAPSSKIEDVLDRYEVLCPVEVIPSGIADTGSGSRMDLVMTRQFSSMWADLLRRRIPLRYSDARRECAGTVRHL